MSIVMKVFHTPNVLGMFINIILCVSVLLVFYCIIVLIEYGTLAVSIIAIFLDVFNHIRSILTLLFLLFFMFYFSFYVATLFGYAVSDEGIGFVKNTKFGWQYIAYIKWEDVASIEYKRFVSTFGVKNLIIHSSAYTIKKKKFMVVAGTQREFKEIVRIVKEKTNLPLQ